MRCSNTIVCLCADHAPDARHARNEMRLWSTAEVPKRTGPDIRRDARPRLSHDREPRARMRVTSSS